MTSGREPKEIRNLMSIIFFEKRDFNNRKKGKGYGLMYWWFFLHLGTATKAASAIIITADAAIAPNGTSGITCLGTMVFVAVAVA
jgi:hypothetical protein